MSELKKEVFAVISHLDGLIDELVVDGHVNQEKLTEFVATLKQTGDVLGLELDLYYGSDYESMSELVEYVIAAGQSDYFELPIMALNPAELKRQLQDFQENIELDEDDEDLAGYLCEFAALVGLWLSDAQADFDIAEAFTGLDIVEEDGNWVEEHEEYDNGWERV